MFVRVNFGHEESFGNFSISNALGVDDLDLDDRYQNSSASDSRSWNPGSRAMVST